MVPFLMERVKNVIKKLEKELNKLNAKRGKYAKVLKLRIKDLKEAK